MTNIKIISEMKKLTIEMKKLVKENKQHLIDQLITEIEATGMETPNKVLLQGLELITAKLQEGYVEVIIDLKKHLPHKKWVRDNMDNINKKVLGSFTIDQLRNVYKAMVEVSDKANKLNIH